MQGRSETFLRLFFLNKGDHTTAAYSRRGRISVLYSGVCVYGVRGRGGDPIDLSLIDLSLLTTRSYLLPHTLLGRFSETLL